MPKSKLPIQVYYLQYKVWLWDQNQGFSKAIFRFRPWNMDFDHFDITPSISECFRNANSTYCGLTWYRPRVNPREKEFGNQNNFHAEIEQNSGPTSGQKKSMCPHLPPTFNDISNKYKSKTLGIFKNWNPFFWFRPEIARWNFVNYSNLRVHFNELFLA